MVTRWPGRLQLHVYFAGAAIRLGLSGAGSQL